MTAIWNDVAQFVPQNLQAMIRMLFDNNVLELVTSGAPTSGSTGTYAAATGNSLAVAGPGSTLTDLAGTNGMFGYLNTNTGASPTWQCYAGPAVGFYTRVPLTAANLIAMYATPVQVLAAPGANKCIIVDQVVLEVILSSTAFTGGGVVGFQYDSTAHLAGTVAHSGTIAASVIQGGAGTSFVPLGPFAAGSGSSTTFPANKGIFISNQTAAFATGTGTAVVHIWYSTISA